MTFEFKFFIILIAIIVILFYLWRRTSASLSEIKFQKHSLSSKYGKMTEQFMPFLTDYPYDPQNFRFIGSPIDGVQFEDDKIIFIEFKTGDSRLSARQQNIKNTLASRRISFEEIRLK